MTARELLIWAAIAGVNLTIEGGDLAYDAPHGVIGVNQLEALRHHKTELLAILRNAARLWNAASLWNAALDQLNGHPEFPSDVMAALRTAKVCWGDNSEFLPARKAAVCKYGSTEVVDVILRHAPHNGQSVRRDCGRCGRFLEFVVWYFNDRSDAFRRHLSRLERIGLHQTSADRSG